MKAAVRAALGAWLLVGMAHVGGPAEDPAAATERLTNTLKWSTASEVENFGYDVYRALGEKGPFERVTEEPVLGAGTTDLPSSYQFVDDTIEPGIAYFYYVESISLHGTRKRFTPVIRARPKSREDDTADPEPETGAAPGPGDP